MRVPPTDQVALQCQQWRIRICDTGEPAARVPLPATRLSHPWRDCGACPRWCLRRECLQKEIGCSHLTTPAILFVTKNDQLTNCPRRLPQCDSGICKDLPLAEILRHQRSARYGAQDACNRGRLLTGPDWVRFQPRIRSEAISQQRASLRSRYVIMQSVNVISVTNSRARELGVQATAISTSVRSTIKK